MADRSPEKTEEATPSGVEDTEKGGPGEEERGGPHAEADGHGEPDKSPKQTEEHDQPQRAEVSNYEIVSHWFGEAAERLGLAGDVAAVLRSSYREVQVPVKLQDGKMHVSRVTASSTTALAGPTRGESGTTPRSTWTRCLRSPS